MAGWWVIIYHALDSILHFCFWVHLTSLPADLSLWKVIRLFTADSALSTFLPSTRFLCRHLSSRMAASLTLDQCVVFILAWPYVRFSWLNHELFPFFNSLIFPQSSNYLAPPFDKFPMNWWWVQSQILPIFKSSFSIRIYTCQIAHFVSLEISPPEHSWLERPAIILVCLFSITTSFPGGLDSKESACSVGDPGSIAGSGRSPGEGNGNPLQYSCLENPMDGGAWQATVHRVTKSQTQLSNFTSLSIIMETPLASGLIESLCPGLHNLLLWSRI